jgi:hypothetical protein
MRCPECHESLKIIGKFCYECTAKLTKICPVCNEIEPIDFPVCKKKFEEAQKKREEYVWQKKEEERRRVAGVLEKFITKWPILFTILALFVSFFNLAFFDSITLLIASLLTLLPLIYLAWKIPKTRRQVNEAEEKAEEEFFEKFPEYGELLRKEKILMVRDGLSDKLKNFQHLV